MRLRPSIHLLAIVALISTLPLMGHLEVDHKPRPDVSPDVPETELNQAREAGKALGKALMGQLSKELRAGGLQSALKVCSEIAPAAVAQHSNETTTVRRVTLKARNPADRPDPWEREQLLRMEKLHAENELPSELARVVDTESGPTLRWLKPIKVSGLCLDCHGDPESFDPDLRSTLQELYPEDEATGYGSGDLRGAFSVSIRLEASH